jgi:hypothetical protein
VSPINFVVAPDRESADLAEAVLTIDVEGRDFLVRAGRTLGIESIGCLERLDPWEDVEFEAADLEALHVALPNLRESLTEAWASGEAPPELTPPALVGFLDVGDGRPFDREGVMRLLVELEILVEHARTSEERLIAIGD